MKMCAKAGGKWRTEVIPHFKSLTPISRLQLIEKDVSTKHAVVKCVKSNKIQNCIAYKNLYIQAFTERFFNRYVTL